MKFSALTLPIETRDKSLLKMAKFPKYKFRLFLMALTLGIYGLFSAPTPDNIGAAEVIIAALLIATVGIEGGAEATTIRLSETFFHFFSKISFLYMLTVTSFIGIAINNNSMPAAIRDIIPLLYMFLFLFLLPQTRSKPEEWIKYCSYGVALVGISFSIRFFINGDVEISKVGSQVFQGDMNYFPISPAVTFSTTFLMLEGFRSLERNEMIRASVLFLASAIAISSIAAMLIRAPLILFATLLVFRVVFFSARGMLGLLIKFLTASALVAASFYIDPIWELIIRKFQQVGANGKLSEFYYAMNLGTENINRLLFGVGWGGEFFSPIFNEKVRYTHEIIAYLLLKVGIVGLFFSILLIWFAFLKTGIEFIRYRFGAGKYGTIRTSALGASAITLASPIFLQASYKSFGFGVVLLIALIANGTFHKKKSRNGKMPPAN